MPPIPLDAVLAEPQEEERPVELTPLEQALGRHHTKECEVEARLAAGERSPKLDAAKLELAELRSAVAEAQAVEMERRGQIKIKFSKFIVYPYRYPI